MKKLKVLLGITGGIAAYKMCEVVRLLIKEGNEVHIVMTESATRFVTPLTFETLSGNPVLTSLWERKQSDRIEHINLSRDVDIVAIAPATANTIGKIANGIADDLLSTMVLASNKPVLLFPSMNVFMYENPVFQDNLEKLGKYEGKFFIIEPDSGELACREEGKGRLPDPQLIVEEIYHHSPPLPYLGKKVVVTAGATREYIDDIRFITNRATGKMGAELSRAFSRYGAEVTLILGKTGFDPLFVRKKIFVETPEEMLNEILKRFDQTDILVMNAAVTDFKVLNRAIGKIKKNEISLPYNLTLDRSIDILENIKKFKKGQIVVGFAAEVENFQENAISKLTKKGLDFIFMNPVNSADTGFASSKNKGVLFDKKGNKIKEFNAIPKKELAEELALLINSHLSE